MAPRQKVYFPSRLALSGTVGGNITTCKLSVDGGCASVSFNGDRQYLAAITKRSQALSDN